jgi:hypothetical protein
MMNTDGGAASYEFCLVFFAASAVRSAALRLSDIVRGNGLLQCLLLGFGESVAKDKATAGICARI